MKEKVQQLTKNLHPKRVAGILETFLKDESLGGKLILVAALVSLIVVNSPFKDEFERFWHTALSIGFGEWSFSLDLKHWVNEGLMALFFLVVGLEIKREFVKGELRNKKAAILPIGAAVGGMLVPAFFYFIFNMNGNAVEGWGIPIATDIAFAVAVLSLLGNRVPVSLKIFLLTLAIADDIGAIFVIALFYAEIINYWFLGAAAILATSMFVFRIRIPYSILAGILGVLLWAVTHESGIHASIVGAIVGFMAPIAKHGTVGPAEKTEKLVLPVSTFVVLPLFALANAGFVISGNSLTANQSVLWGIFVGLVFGKLIGITLASWLLVKLKIAQLPTGMKWGHVVGVGLLAGIGFTVSIFITELAFSGDTSLLNTAKTSIFIASATSALTGYVVLRYTKIADML